MDIDAFEIRIAEIAKKTEMEGKILHGAMVMLNALKDKSARDQCEVTVIESKRRLEFLETESTKLCSLRDESLKPKSEHINEPRPMQSQEIGSAAAFTSTANINASADAIGFKKRNASDSMQRGKLGAGRSGNLLQSIVSSIKGMAGSRASLGSPLDHINARTVISAQGQSKTSLNSCADDAVPITGLDALKFSSALTTDKIKYRFEHVREKTDIESKFLEGIDNMIDAIKATTDPRTISDLESQSNDSKRKLLILQKADRKYGSLYVSSTVEEEKEDEIIQSKLHQFISLINSSCKAYR